MTSTRKERRVDARNLALDTLLKIEKDKSPSHLVMRDVLRAYPDLEQREERFYRKLVNGVLEWQIRLDYIIDQFSKTKTRKMKPVIRGAMRIAVYQICFLDAVPDSAAVNEAVRIADQRGFHNLRGFVNGVLRAIVRGKDKIHYPDRNMEPVRYISIMYSVPEYLAGRWYSKYGPEKTERICSSFQKQAPLTVRFRDEMPEMEVTESRQLSQKAKCRTSLQAAGVTVAQAPYIHYAGYLSGVVDLEKIPAFTEGGITVQDVSSMLAVEAAGIQKGDLVLDLAAAPGGKSMLAADLLHRVCGGTADIAKAGAADIAKAGAAGIAKAGAADAVEVHSAQEGKVIARDVSLQKAELIRENIDRLRITNIEVQVWDGTVFDPDMEAKADVVIADLPCSGLGVIGRKPDIRYEASEEKTESLVALQRRILKNAVRYVKPGGTLLFSTCTFDPRENEENAAWILEHSDLRPDPVAPFLPAELAEEAGSCNYLQLYPGIHACDGFFIARFRKGD